MRTSIADYASDEMLWVWSSEHRIQMERALWVEIMQFQRNCGLDIPQEAIDEYLRFVDKAEQSQIDAIEQRVRHDLRARLEHFNAQTGFQYAHWGLTSCDITDVAAQIQIRESLVLVRKRVVGVLELLAAHIQATRDTICVARTHNQPAQPTLLGKRFATLTDALILADGALVTAFRTFPFRGVTGAVGTAADMSTLMGPDLAEDLSASLQQTLGFDWAFVSPTQVYPRSEDLNWISALKQITEAATQLAVMVRLESSSGRMWEHFDDKQVGSSAMPHKRNPVMSERICGLRPVVHGFAAMLETSGWTQWYEGDVSDSVTRRVGLSGLFQAVDAILSTAADLLGGLDLSKADYENEYLDLNPVQIRSGELLAWALSAGADRDEAYAALREARGIEDLHSDHRFPFSYARIAERLSAPPPLDVAKRHIDRVLKTIEEVNQIAIG